MTTDSKYMGSNPGQYLNWWLDTVHQSMLYNNESLKSRLDSRHANLSNIPPVLQDANRQQINDIANFYTDWTQYMYELSLNQLSIASEWSERAAHLAHKTLGIKTTDN